MNNLLKDSKFCTFKLIYNVENWANLSKKHVYKEYQTMGPTFNKYIYYILFYFIFKTLNFLKMSPIFVGSVHNFGRSDDDTI